MHRSPRVLPAAIAATVFLAAELLTAFARIPRWPSAGLAATVACVVYVALSQTNQRR